MGHSQHRLESVRALDCMVASDFAVRCMEQLYFPVFKSRLRSLENSPDKNQSASSPTSEVKLLSVDCYLKAKQARCDASAAAGSEMIR